ncbi:creatininase family protein [Acetobacterium sp.]|jgi:creatinine amidohydrolase|uniref:creatininase family protein n=1 Tax=Acetobacterium sp. TaxID=1872094 RepID=UPI000CB26575|nr:creatininase family protein [Acetobacterium sp.]MDO9492215.1 creatininase family protein [Acetobacterium sp.]PKM71814.1 MAG: creatininase [Firmicutes bacterium HGW-Firmicutes-17]
MKYSIFKDTLVDMPYPEIEESIKQNAWVLLPISVVEEHGPHLCTGTDIYLTQSLCQKVKQKLKVKDHPVVIAPPFYWGVNSITDGFVGSFSIKPETMTMMVLEILDNLNKWGFKKIFLLNFHGDFIHIKTIVEIVEQANKKNIEAYFLIDKNLISRMDLNQDAAYLASVELDPNKANLETSVIDIHAGATETSWMALSYNKLVDIEKAKTLKPTNLTISDLKAWLMGGEFAKSMTPLGYCGNPSNIDLEKIKIMEDIIAEKYASAIIKFSENTLHQYL